ncbi:MAG: beta-propeller fold lactonase family protein, partial [Burkholderiaceae bacterium]
MFEFSSGRAMRALLLAGIAGMLAACGGGGGGGGPGGDFAIRVTVSGLAGTGLVLQNQARDPLAIAANGAATFATRQGSGSVYSISVATQPSGPAQGCVVANGSGTVVAADVVDITVVCRNAARFAYVANYAGNNLTQFDIGIDGTLTPMVPPFVIAGTRPTSVAIDPQGRFLYVANEGGTVSQYAIGNDGKLGALVPDSVVVGGIPTSITVDPSGRFVYLANDNGSVSPFSIGVTGALTAIAAPPVFGGTGPAGITVDPSGRFAYLANDGATVSQYAIGGNGSLVVGAYPPILLAGTPLALTTDPDGRFAWVALYSGNAIGQ